MTAPTDRHRDVGDKCDTGVTKIKKIRGRENNSIGTWNLRTLKPAGKLELLTHAMGKYQRKTEGLCEMRLKNFGEMSKMTDTRFISLEKRANTSIGFDFLCMRT